MTLYSAQLGSFHSGDSGVTHLLYTVPAGGGRAVVKAVVLDTIAGSNPQVIVSQGAVGGVPIATLFVPAGQPEQTLTVITFVVLLPGDTIKAYNQGAAGFWSVVVGGYQFSS